MLTAEAQPARTAATDGATDNGRGAAGDLPRVLLVADAASLRFGGEAVHPVHYFRILRARGVDVRLVVHERTRDELLQLFPADADRLHFVPDTAWHRVLNRVGQWLPHRVDYALFGFWSHAITQRRQRALIRRLVAEHDVEVVHQSIPLSAKEPSLLYDLGCPVVIGPLNGNMRYPAGIRAAGGLVESAIVGAARWFSNVANRIMPGKLRCDTLLVANARTEAGLPAGVSGRVVRLIDNSVDLSVWQTPPRPRRDGGPARFIYVGRLVDWKAVDLLVAAFARTLGASPDVHLHLVGDGPELGALERQVAALNVAKSVTFHGWQSQPECARRMADADVFVLPSVYECGGAVVLEAMAVGLPVIATNWGGPADYLDETCGVLVEPTSRDALIDGFARAMSALATDAALRRRLGEAGRAKVVAEFDWQRKVDRTLDIYRDAISRMHARGGRRG